MEQQAAEKSISLWIGYVLLFLFTFSMYFQPLALLGVAALVLGYLARSRFRKQEQLSSVAVSHASWQINTVWLALLLGVLALVVLFAIAAWMGNTPAIGARLDAIANSDATPQEMLRALWAIPGTKAMAATIILFTLLCLIWSLKRVLHGMLALRLGLEPGSLGSGRWLALALAVVAHLIPTLLFVLL